MYLGMCWVGVLRILVSVGMWVWRAKVHIQCLPGVAPPLLLLFVVVVFEIGPLIEQEDHPFG